MAPPIGGVDSGGRRRDFSLTDMAAISGSWVSYIFTSLANLRTPERKADQIALKLFLLPLITFSMLFICDCSLYDMFTELII